MELTFEIQKLLTEELAWFGTDLIQALESNISKYDLVSSSELKNSLRQTVIRIKENELASRIQFALQGKIRDMKPAYSNKMPPVEEIIKFIESKGLQSFKFVPGTRRTPVDDMDKRKIAWGIAFSRTRKKLIPKPKKWKNKTIGAAINTLSEKLLQRYTEVTGLAIIQNQE